MMWRGNVPSLSGQVLDIELAERIQAILGSKGLTLYQASQRSSALFGRSSPFFLPHNLYYELRRGAFTPSVYQLFAFSRISGYRVVDWFRIFGIDLEDVPRLQVLLPNKRTIVIDTSLTDTQGWVIWFRNKRNGIPVDAIMPLAQLIEPDAPRRIGSVSPAARSLYIKIGSEDAFAFSDVIPGSIVEVNPAVPASALPKEGELSERLFLIEHGRGFICARLRRVEENIIVPVGSELAFAQIELRLPSHARVLGLADMELRFLGRVVQPNVPKDLAQRWEPEAINRLDNLGQLLNRARRNANLSLREAAAMSRVVSQELGASARISPSSLCDYEVTSTAPRNLHKVVSLCCLYGLRLQDLLTAAGVSFDQAGTEPMPDSLVGRRLLAGPAPERIQHEMGSETGFSGQLVASFRNVPFFMRNAVASFAGLRRISVDDFFCLGGEVDALHPYFRKALIALVNQRRKTPAHFASKPLWKQPVYLLLRRDGSYVCACCSREGSTVVIHPYTEQFHRDIEFGYRKDVEVIGEIVAIARKLA